jgi:hypothetical protein
MLKCIVVLLFLRRWLSACRGKIRPIGLRMLGLYCAKMEVIISRLVSVE